MGRGAGLSDEEYLGFVFFVFDIFQKQIHENSFQIWVQYTVLE